MTFGMGHNHGGTSVFPHMPWNGEDLDQRGFVSALDHDEAVEAAIRVAEGRGDDKSVAPLRACSRIEVLIPDVFTLQSIEARRALAVAEAKAPVAAAAEKMPRRPRRTSGARCTRSTRLPRPRGTQSTARVSEVRGLGQRLQHRPLVDIHVLLDGGRDAAVPKDLLGDVDAGDVDQHLADRMSEHLPGWREPYPGGGLTQRGPECRVGQLPM